MFSLEVLDGVVAQPQFIQDYSKVREGLAFERAGQRGLFDDGLISRLSYFVEGVLASAPSWTDSGRCSDMCRIAAEIAELLALKSQDDSALAKRLRVRSTLLYEIAGYPALAAATLDEADFSTPLRNVVSRKGAFRQLVSTRDLLDSGIGEPDNLPFVEAALYSDVSSIASYQQGFSDEPSLKAAHLLAGLSRDFAFGHSASEMCAWEAVLKRHVNAAVRRYVSDDLFEHLRQMQFPAELWSIQTAAVEGGLLSPDFDAWGLAAPTGTGKTFLTRLLIASTLRDKTDSIVLYLVPSRALVYEVSSDLSRAFHSLGYAVSAVTPQLVALDDAEAEALSTSSVLVLTPEKADLLLRLGSDILSRVSLVIVDEAHHIESSTRGVLLEMYLWRIRRRLDLGARFVLLSAVAPNIREVVGWIGSHPGSVFVDQRATRMRVGVYRIQGRGRAAQGVITYSDGTVLPIIPKNVESAMRRCLVQLASCVVQSGPVLVVAKGKKECETLAKVLLEWLSGAGTAKTLSEEVLQKEVFQRLDSRLEREMYPEVTLRTLIAHRIAYHHAGLPPSVRNDIEDAIRNGLIDYVFATTTLAEGVNFPFSTVIVQALAIREAPEKGKPARYHPVTPRVFWNIAGRAGRPGHDPEGQVILFEPSLGLDKISYVLGDYLNPQLSSIKPVRSALADTISEVEAAVSNDELTLQELQEIKLPERASKRVQGAINLLRVSLLHARASQFAQSPEEIYESTFAAQCLPTEQQDFARRLFELQDTVVLEFLTTPRAPSPELIAELGLSIETLTDLRDWVSSLADWQIESLRNTMHGGNANLVQVKYTVGPVAKHMAELEGKKLGGFLSEIIVHWISGVPFRSIWRDKKDYWGTGRMEDLISVVYSRVQFLLPWGLYATDRLVEAEAQRRGIKYQNQLRSLAYLADAGVPTFDALRLVSAQFERADATRLAAIYHRNGGLRSGFDVLGWLATQPVEVLTSAVRGTESRRVEFGFEQRLRELRVEQR